MVVGSGTWYLTTNLRRTEEYLLRVEDGTLTAIRGLFTMGEYQKGWMFFTDATITGA